MKGYDPVLAQREGLEPDWFYYAFKQLRNPLTRIFSILFGFEFNSKNMDKEQPSDYLWRPYLDIIRDNNEKQKQNINKQSMVDNFFEKKKTKTWVFQDDSVKVEPGSVPTNTQAQQKQTNMKNLDIRNMFAKK